MAKKRTFREFKQGIFKPINKAKCLNKSDIVYRSGLESKLMMQLDKNSNVISWSSEAVIIPYWKPGENRIARYFVDFYAKLKIGDTVKEYLFEVKPHRQISKPVANKNKKQSTILYENIQYAINTAKWKAAEEYCAKKGYKFLIITEKNIETILGK